MLETMVSMKGEDLLLVTVRKTTTFRRILLRNERGGRAEKEERQGNGMEKVKEHD
jgi:hypothetical protein